MASSSGYPTVECACFFYGFWVQGFILLHWVCAMKNEADKRAKKRCLLLCSAQLLRPTVPTNDKCAIAANWQPAALDVAQPPSPWTSSLLDRQQQLLCRQTQSLNDRLNESVNKWMNQCEPPSVFASASISDFVNVINANLSRPIKWRHSVIAPYIDWHAHCPPPSACSTSLASPSLSLSLSAIRPSASLGTWRLPRSKLRFLFSKI